MLIKTEYTVIFNLNTFRQQSFSISQLYMSTCLFGYYSSSAVVFGYRNRPHIEYNIWIATIFRYRNRPQIVQNSINAYMDLMSNMGENQNKESPVRIIREHRTTISPE